MSSGHNTLVNDIPYDVFQLHFFKYSVIGNPSNASYINNNTCLKITANTTFTLNQNLGNINFVAVGGGRTGIAEGLGGAGGGIVYGTIKGTSTMIVVIGAANANTTITGTGVSITASSTGLTSTASGSNVVSPTSVAGGAGGAYSWIDDGMVGSDGYYISRLQIYVSGGGGGGSDGVSGAAGGVGGAGGGGHGTRGGGGDGGGTAGTINTGGGGGSGFNTVWNGGSGVVYFFI